MTVSLLRQKLSGTLSEKRFVNDFASFSVRSPVITTFMSVAKICSPKIATCVPRNIAEADEQQTFCSTAGAVQAWACQVSGGKQVHAAVGTSSGEVRTDTYRLWSPDERQSGHSL